MPLLPRTWSLWLLRIVLIAPLILHLHAAYRLTVINRTARRSSTSPARLRDRQLRQPHDALDRHHRAAVPVLAPRRPHVGWFNPDFVRGEVYRNLDASLSPRPVAILYIVANIALGIHLFHGTWSLFQSMGWNNPRFNQWRRHRHRHRHDRSWSATSRSRSPSWPA